MDNKYKDMIWLQFGAAIDTLENTIAACPEEHWSSDDKSDWRWDVWYWSYHTLFWLDYYLNESPDTYTPTAPFTMSEMAPEGGYPPRVYTKHELLDYAEHGRQKCRERIAAMTEEEMHSPSPYSRRGLTVGEMLLYNMRHVQHHAAQVNIYLKQKTGSATEWVGRTKTPLIDE